MSEVALFSHETRDEHLVDILRRENTLLKEGLAKVQANLAESVELNDENSRILQQVEQDWLQNR